MPLHPAEHRGYRELFIAAQQAQTRLQRLAGHLDGEPAAAVGNAHVALRELVDDLEPVLARHNLYAEHAARGNGVRIGLGVCLIGTLLAETKLSNSGVGFLVIQAYSLFNMPLMYALLIVLFVIAIGANALIGRFGGLDDIKRR